MIKLQDIREEAIQGAAALLDRPSVYMGGPSSQSLRRAERVVEYLIWLLDRNTCIYPAADSWRDYDHGFRDGYQAALRESDGYTAYIKGGN